jgi:hypothetical protein
LSLVHLGVLFLDDVPEFRRWVLHPEGSQQVFPTKVAYLYTLMPDQRCAKHAGQCSAEVEGGLFPTRDWFLAVQILTSGGFR